MTISLTLPLATKSRGATSSPARKGAAHEAGEHAPLNFRQYYGEQRMEFAHSAEKNVTVIHGANGAGETSFFLALNWCLYGEMDEKHGLKERAQLVSKEALSRAADGEAVTCRADLNFKHDGVRYVVSRSFEAEKLAGNLARVKSPDHFVMMAVGSDGQATKIPTQSA